MDKDVILFKVFISKRTHYLLRSSNKFWYPILKEDEWARWHIFVSLLVYKYKLEVVECWVNLKLHVMTWDFIPEWRQILVFSARLNLWQKYILRRIERGSKWREH